MDDGRCHICRQYPLRVDKRYTITTCEDCDETAEEGPVSRVVLVCAALAAIVTAINIFIYLTL